MDDLPQTNTTAASGIFVASPLKKANARIAVRKGSAMSQRAREAAEDWRERFGRKGSFADLKLAFARLETEALERGRMEGAKAMQEAAAQRCREEQAAFLSPEYATYQPMSSFGERFACGQCAATILAIDTAALKGLTDADTK